MSFVLFLDSCLKAWIWEIFVVVESSVVVVLMVGGLGRGVVGYLCDHKAERSKLSGWWSQAF